MMMDPEEVFLCHKCGKMFYKLSTLESHVKWKHSEKSDEFMCDQCGRTFQKKFNLDKHIISGVHFIEETVNCALCEYRALNRKIMAEHYERFHNIWLKESHTYFTSAEEFFKWKHEFEKKTKSRFVKLSSSRKRKNGFMRSSYFCHRDGNFVSKGRNKRHLKLKGSNKINAHCPAKMDVDFGNNIVNVSYIDIHLGHDLDVSRLSLDPKDKAFIAQKLAMQVPFEEILQEINKTKDNDINRVNLITRKDLWNIVDAYKINPKTIVYNRTRGRKKKFEQPQKQPKRNQVFFKVLKQESAVKDSEKKEETVYIIDENNEDEQIISTNKQAGVTTESIIDEDENMGQIQYALISDENDGGDGTCLIINSDGELESISGHKLIYTEDGELQIIEANEEINEVENGEATLSIVEEASNDFNELSVFKEKEAKEVKLEDCKGEVSVINERDFVKEEKQQIKSNLSDVRKSCHKKSKTSRVTKALNKRKLKKAKLDLDLALMGTTINLTESSNLSKQDFEEDSGYEFVMIDGTEEINNEYVIVTTEEELNQCNMILEVDDANHELNDIPPDSLEENKFIISEEEADNIISSEEQYIETGRGEEGVDWIKQEEVLNENIDENNDDINGVFR